MSREQTGVVLLAVLVTFAALFLGPSFIAGLLIGFWCGEAFRLTLPRWANWT